LPPFQLTQAFSLDSSVGEYNAQYQRIIDYIYAGDCYQVNFAQRLSSVYSGHLWNAYTALRTKSPAPYSAFMQFPEDTLLSHSPESFLSVQQRHVTTQPIKGTRRRSPNHTEDKRLKSELTSSLKDRSENLMIVDLMRNDLGKHCKTGSITADELFTLKSFSNVHHLVSTVRGELAPNSHPLDLFRDSFPGGSITGAPKKRAMEIINELEPFDRGAYCGSLGYLSFDGQMNTNIAIRTLSNEGARLYCWGGGGIVADSNCEEEYLESLDKINNLIETLNKL
ncbi:MAG: aminodeoxychorismate synthase component I, partial [Gammaproteobacteria bacterium]|nr:aminodeoxychorismate synthase component I [Gammaproteobacteria bacterium]